MHAENLLGWATDILVQLDDQTPGVISRVLTAAPARRNSIFAALATHEGAKLEAAEAKDLAQVVRHGRPVDILRYAHGTVPTGFVGALSSIAKPFDRAEDYVRLHGLLTTGQPNLVEALRGGPPCRDKLNIFSVLDPRWTHINVLSRIESSHDARTFNRAEAERRAA